MADDSWRGEQIDFYEADAVPVDDWITFLRDPRNDTPPAIGFRARLDRLRLMFDRLASGGRILEIAAGTGAISLLLAPRADHLVLLDTSATSLDIACRHLATAGHGNVTTVHADVFAWEPASEDPLFDVICFGAWLHHVPTSHFERFWERIDRLLAPSGVVICDVATGVAAGAGVPPPEPGVEYAHYHDPTNERSVRDLGGRRWCVVHRVWDLTELEAELRRLGWSMQIELEGGDDFDWISATKGEAVGRPDDP